MALQVVGYIRVSTDEQQQGPRAQRDEIERWCAARGAELVAVHEDCGVSGAAALDARPGLMAALDELTKGGVLLVTKRDRLARDVIAAAMIERSAARPGASVVTCCGAGDGEGPEALLMRRMIDAFAEYERELIRARTRAALAAKKARGEVVGELPIGSERAADGCKLAVNADEARAVALIRALRCDGMSLREIAAELSVRGVAARGARWHATTVARVLAREAA